MKKISYILTLTIALLSTVSCEDLVEGINDNPNDIIVSDVEDRLFLTGAMLANIQVNCGHLNRISGMYSGQLIGFSSLYSNIYGYNLSTAESNGEWNAIYVGVITNMNHIINNSGNTLLVGISKVVKAHAVGTAASLFGDIPYSETGNPEIPDPVFDPQIDVYTNVIALLDDAIANLGSAGSASVSEDIYYGGDKTKWIAAANTLKARFYLHQKNYASALTAAQNGISSADGDMKFIPGDAAADDKNLFWKILEGSRAGDIGNNSGGSESYLLQLLDASNAISRNNAKTNEA
ncbi:MAG: SusD/RagB family nutrient-binding outer membrane lipoprotein, partial [Flavobacteriaceae bacterium]|nr:SusD/RagB family nutrient-binding outer membrane lipoprotein [Flavobacteriaceae bacterium]